MKYDVLVVGAGPSGLFAALRGVSLEEMPDGRVFLSSRRAQDLLDLLLVRRGVFVLNSGRAYESER